MSRHLRVRSATRSRPWSAAGLWALLLALWLVPLAGRMHQVAHAQGHAPAAAQEPAQGEVFAHHDQVPNACLLLDHQALGDGLAPMLPLPLAALPAAAVHGAALWGQGAQHTAIFQARAPPEFI